jgi:hypothetical protein
MAIDDKISAALADVKAQLEKATGKEIDVDTEQLAFFSFPVGSSFYEENSQTTWRRIIFEGKFCNSPVRLLDATGRTSTGADGKRVFLLSDFICSDTNSFAEPIFLQATPKTATPCYVTLMHELVKNPNSPIFNDLQITAFTWKPDGEPAPNIPFDWRCRVVSNIIIL